LLAIQLSGIICCLLLVIKSFKSGAPEDRFCRLIKKGNCTSVLDSRYAKIGSVSLSEIGLGYFLFNTSLLLFNYGNIEAAISIVTWSYMFALPVTVASVYVQYKIIKSWCLYCLLVQLLIWLGFLTGFKHLTIPVHANWLNQVRIAALSGIAILAGLVIVNIFIRQASKIRLLSKDLSRFKGNTSIFQKLLADTVPVKTENAGALTFGTPNSHFLLTMITNPFCEICKLTHKQIKDLYNKNRERFSLEIIFSIDSSTPYDPESDIIFAVCAYFVSLYHSGTCSQEDVLEILDDWYTTGVKNPEHWLKERRSGINKEVGRAVIQKHINWCKENLKNIVPVIFINHRLKPAVYRIKDLGVFVEKL